MTSLTNLIRTAKAEALVKAQAKGANIPCGHALTEGDITVRIVPVQPRGHKPWSHKCIRADVYINDSKIKTAEVAAILKSEA
jgi:hypothetical protein